MIPEDNNKAVFNKGITNGLNGEIIVGGQILPISGVGDNLEWKKDQKNDKKKKISDVIKRSIPTFNPNVTFIVWFPWNVLSREISRHHKAETKNTIDILKIIIICLVLINIKINPLKRAIALNEDKIGQGLILTIW